MRRKLVNYEVFQQINESSLTRAEEELINAEETLARALGEEQLTLHSFDESNVTYETLDKSYVRAGYNFDNGHIVFENIEQLVIDESSARKKAHEVLAKMFDEMLNDNDAKASEHLKEYIKLPTVRRDFSEGRSLEEATNPQAIKKQNPTTVMKKVRSKMFHQKMVPQSLKTMLKQKRHELKKRNPGAHINIRSKPQAKKKMMEWYNLKENVLNYIDYQEFGPVANQSSAKQDEKGNVVTLRLPNAKLRNETKILAFNWKTLSTDNVVLRAKMKNLAEDVNFCRAVADLKKCNALADDTRMQQVLEAIAVRWPDVIYLTQVELAGSISKALETLGENNYDDDVCNFLAEGILRTAANAYSEKVEKIISLSGIKFEASDDRYIDFQRVVSKFYKFLDENVALEMQVFVDLYNALVEVHKIAKEDHNEYVLGGTNKFLHELKAVLEQEAEPTIELAGDAANWLALLVETNLETGPWNVSNTPYITTAGEHPNMAKLAAKPYNPADDFSGNWGDPLPSSDGTAASYKSGKLSDEMRTDAWGNWANDNTWPAITNPYVPKASVWTMKGEKGADVSGDDDWSRWQSGETWPALQNPNVPKEAGGVGGKGYKMKSDNLVVDQ